MRARGEQLNRGVGEDLKNPLRRKLMTPAPQCKGSWFMPRMERSLDLRS